DLRRAIARAVVDDDDLRVGPERRQRGMQLAHAAIEQHLLVEGRENDAERDRRGTHARLRNARAGTPATVVPAGTSRVTTAPAPITAPSSIVMPPKISA